MTEPTMPNPRNVLDCGPGDEVPVREVLSRLATFIGGPLAEYIRVELDGHEPAWDGPNREVARVHGALVVNADHLFRVWDKMHTAQEHLRRPAVVPGPEPGPAPRDKVVDLMAELERSVAAAKEARGRHPQPGKGQAAPPRRPTPPKGGGVPPPKHPQPGREES
jgi:hypothetical protein